MEKSNIMGLAIMFWPDKRRRVNFTNPANGRLWLKLLRPDPRHGLRFQPDLHVTRRDLGFSFTSNRFGLRGPDNPKAPNVLLGTSFAMGLSVNDGENWYEYALDREQWFNAAMPVGPHNQNALLDDLYKGSGDTLLYLYHPNIWKTAQGYLKAKNQNRSIFEVMRWKTDLLGTARLFPRWIAKEIAKVAKGLVHYRRVNGKMYFFNASYCQLDVNGDQELIDVVQGDINRLFARFRRVIVLRVPIKEELAADQAFSPQLIKLAVQYDHLWKIFQERVESHVETTALPRNAFGFGDFLPYDTHWSKDGNRRFAQLLQPILAESGALG